MLDSNCYDEKFNKFTVDIINEYNLKQYITLNQYLENPKHISSILPNSKGVYFVIYPYDWTENSFLLEGFGGWFKGKNPNVSLEELRINWVESTDILYIGKAGGMSRNGKISNSTLNKRIKELLRFGNGKKVGHWGGRYLWQHKDSYNFRVYWYSCKENENPVELEKELIERFANFYNKKPFANLE